MAWDAFISCSHAAEADLAHSLQVGLQRLAKPWWRPRALATGVCQIAVHDGSAPEPGAVAGTAWTSPRGGRTAARRSPLPMVRDRWGGALWTTWGHRRWLVSTPVLVPERPPGPASITESVIQAERNGSRGRG